MATLMLDYGDFPPGFHPLKVKGILFEFGLNYLLDHPKNILTYGLEYFEKVCAPRKTILTYAAQDVEEEEKSSKYSGYQESEIVNIVMNTTPTLRCLPEADLEELKKLCKRREVEADEVILNQGDHYDYFYIIESGIFEAFIETHDFETHKVYTYHDSGCFGELAFLNLKPRMATVIAKTKGFLWYCDQTVFVCYIKKHLRKHRNLMGKFYQDCHYLKALTPYERIVLVDNTRVKTFQAGDFVYKEGYIPGGFWYVLSGSVECVICDDILQVCALVRKYIEGDHFGEYELYIEEVRTASVVACVESLLATIPFDVFQKLPEAVHSYFKKDLAVYENKIRVVKEKVAEDREEFMKSPYYKEERCDVF